MTDAITWTQITVRLGDLKPWSDNPRTSTKKQAAKLLESWNEFGQVQTVAVGPGLEVLDGHQRLSALLAVHGKGYTVDARQSSRALTEDERKRLVVLLHAGAVGSWNWDDLSNWNAGDLIEWGLDDATLTTWKQDIAALGNMLESEKPDPTEDPGAQVDRAEELRELWGTSLGQMWACGEHRIICGDCTDAAVVERVMGGEKAEMVFTDPPYGIGYDSNMPGSEWADKIRNDDDTRIADSWLQVGLPISTGSGVFICSRWDVLPDWLVALQNAKLKVKNVIVWVKSLQGMGDLEGAFGSRWEAVIFAHDGAFRLAGKRIDDVWDIGHIFTRGHRHHPTEKPVGLPAMAIEHASVDGAIIYDPFAGSGTTGIACENLGRKARMIEIDPGYCAVI